MVRPVRPPDLVSKRGIPYYFAPEWVRDLNGTMCRIRAVKHSNDQIDLYILSKDGNLSYIEGSIQVEFHDWIEEQKLDCLILGIEMDNVTAAMWEYE